ncbi:hypothetical protein PIB30_061977 [Stylosanthes scabra]|uniref:Uncharacterized protein n=1 Tax=Stylosanthes scabra TaxID=79078 RepID=A0ABU6TMD4_9FABA|nr:hypothetical protein [Stylosanthes scabra]
MSVRPGKGRKIFGLYEDSFHDFKGRYFKIFPVGDHRPFWLSLEGDGLFPPYWSDQAGFDIVLVTYQRLNADQRDTVDILLHLFSKNNLAPKSLLSNLGEARRAIVEMAGNNVTFSRPCNLLRPPQAGATYQARVVPARSGPSSLSRASTLAIIPTSRSHAIPEGGVPVRRGSAMIIWLMCRLQFGRKSCVKPLRINVLPMKALLGRRGQGCLK